MAKFSAKLTSKNQLTLPAGISALLRVRPGDVVTFTTEDEFGDVRVSGPDPEERLQPWVGRWVVEGNGAEVRETDAWIRSVRGPRE